MARILVADDEEGLREFIAEVLEMDGHVVQTAVDGQAAAEALDRAGFDLLVTDLNMPRMDGMALIQKVRAESPEVEILVLTAYGTVGSAVAAMKLGAFDYVQKPIESPASLRLVVGRALERGKLLRAKARAGLDRPTDRRLTFGDPAMVPVVDALKRVARTQATVLLTGESGVGKEVAARAVHDWSPRADGPFVAVNCAVLTDNLLESELFGHERGAFTGAHARKRGRLELAAGGTFFLDEVGELPVPIQAKLLRVLQERTYERVGGERTLTAEVRWIAATNRDLPALIEAGRFREDLYHRIAVFPVRLPPLRERRGDLAALARVLLRDISRELGVATLRLSPEAEAKVAAGDWPGNVRALRNALERAAILADGGVIDGGLLDGHPAAMGGARAGVGLAASPAVNLEDMERDAIRRALAAVHGNRRKAAERLGIGLRTLYDKLKKYEIK